VVSLSPSAFATSPAGTDAFAVTMPAIGVSVPPISAPPAVTTEPTSDTLLASGPPAALSTKPPSSPSSPSSPSRAPISGSRSSSKNPSKNPSSGPGGVPSVRPVIEEGTTGVWIALWIVAGLVSIGIGVYFALR
jgi:hypothetical protein